ncbi:dTDP-3-amino-3,4,6-trideoxy-alpha-D-glucose transaminase [Tepidimonas alkaliphilus]|uniref:dTDP-3-amino-3,4,6-trideoxy-alpha-D-glucose transaminase n=1 Tax=Tepidimonas alkaliphilus TaxID=2588942 RepID=A0A554W4Y8_9BURK|nr:DegT/DnrJ/EryC1/StrS family aminotransferase [Tepidimonas alkaliphilus]TSE18646.1 dTDP-3-amino-3,4,6-trideoxy-alpha-D-glucose transaminase [Tepidimonas alkaliphilus]
MSATVAFLDLGAAYRELKEEIDAAVHRVLASGCYVLGAEVEAFEAEWAAYCQAQHAVGVSNGLDALILALQALGIGPGDEVIVPSNTYIATWLAVSEVGAVVAPVEPDPSTYTLDPARVEASISPRTRAILAVHLYGQPADLDPLLTLARRYGLYLIEDAAQAHGARYKGQRIGAHGDAVCWSFYPSKNLGALGDAGAVTTNDSAIAERIRLLRNYGSRRKYHHELRGRNARLDPIQAAVLRVKLAYLDSWNERRRALAACYHEKLACSELALPKQAPWADHVWHLFVVRTPKRDELQRHLATQGIETLIHYPIPPHRQTAYRDLFSTDKTVLPIAEILAGEVLSLPIGPHVKLEAAERIAQLTITWQGLQT